jgi:CBS domain-containing protein/anti-sigma regulatory factor (Ser/Thr protein kinase)
MPEDSPVTFDDRAAGTITRVEELAYELKVHEMMSPHPHVISPEMLMGAALELFREARISGAPVVQGSDLKGVISIEDMIRCLRANDLKARVSDYMTVNLFTVRSTDPVVEALKEFVRTKVGRLIVVDEAGHLAGIITKGDINVGLLRALEMEYQEEEVRRYRASHLFEDIVSDRTSLILRYTIKPRDFTHGGSASSHLKRALLRLGASPLIARRAGIAVYEAEINLIIHTTNGGILRAEIEPHRITIEATDDGPGIADVEQALKPGFSTATEEIREQGFGAGMGLVNIARCVDEMKLDSTLGKGTRLRMKIDLQKEEGFGDVYTHLKE